MKGRQKTHDASVSNHPGVMLFSTSKRPICYDERAEELCQKLENKSPSTAPENNFKVPTVLRRYCSSLLRRLRAHPHLKDCRHFKISRVLTHDNVKLLLYGFGFPAAAGTGRPLVLLLVQELADHAAVTIYRAQRRFLLTEREASVLHHLLKGWTNKEIAQALHITEQCVKQHIKHIMIKTNSSTRTQIILSVLSSNNSNAS